MGANHMGVGAYRSPNLAQTWKNGKNYNKFKTLLLVSKSLISTTDDLDLVFQVTKGQTDCAIPFAIYKLL